MPANPEGTPRQKPMLPGAGDPSIKARKQLLFEPEELPALESGPGKPFAQYLRETPAAPMPLWVKAALGAAGLVVAALLVAALLKLGQPRKPRADATSRLDRPAAPGLAADSPRIPGLPGPPARSLG
jgi:hypothetical protein